MGIAKTPRPVQFFTSIIFSDEIPLFDAKKRLQAAIGNFQEETAFMLFSQTDYYEREMGGNLSRIFILFEPLFQRDMLPDIKLKTNDIELALALKGKRMVNIDPGYISLENIILATTKGYAHRIYVGNGIYGDLTLTFSAGTYRPLGWTYPDYGSKEVISLLNRWRESLKGRRQEDTKLGS
jgi:hypothetical protein